MDPGGGALIKALRLKLQISLFSAGCDCAVEHCGAATQAAVVQTLAPLTKPFVPVWMAVRDLRSAGWAGRLVYLVCGRGGVGVSQCPKGPSVPD